MDIFKTKQGADYIYNIADDYIKITGKKTPFCVVKSTGESFYAVCPVCDNPIQIIGLYKNTVESGKKPYGKHHKGNLSLAQYNEEDYYNCPLSNHNFNKKSCIRSPKSAIGKQVLDLVFSQFDRIVYLLSKDIDIYISNNTAENMLNNFIREKAWLYRDINLLNIPWVFGESMKALPMFGRLIRRGSQLYEVLKSSCPEIELVNTDKQYSKIKSNNGAYCNLYYLLHNHKIQKTSNDNLDETIDFWVYRGPVPNPKTIYTKTIKIDSCYFQNLINNNDNEKYRNKKLLEIANNIKDRLTPSA